MWNRRIELDGFLPLLHSVRNKTSFFKGKVVPGTRNEINQSPEIVVRGIEMFKILDETTHFLPKNKPRYLMGVGTPSDILGAINFINAIRISY